MIQKIMVVQWYNNINALINKILNMIIRQKTIIKHNIKKYIWYNKINLILILFKNS